MAAARKAPALLGSFGQGLRRWAYNASGFNQIGLRHDDVLYETEDVKEALRRLPQSAVDERSFRIMRALQLSMSKQLLPKSQWTKYEEDTRYLQPYLEEVIREREEKEEWSKK